MFIAYSRIFLVAYTNKRLTFISKGVIYFLPIYLNLSIKKNDYMKKCNKMNYGFFGHLVLLSHDIITKSIYKLRISIIK